MTPLRVLFCPFYPAVPYQQRLAEALRPLGVEVEGVRTVGIERPSFARELAAFRPHVLHLHWLHPWFLGANLPHTLLRTLRFLFELQRARRGGAALVFTVHNLVNHELHHPRVDRFVTRRVARLADALVVHGEHARQAVVEACGEQVRDRIHVIPMGHQIDDYPNTVSRAAARRELGVGDATTLFLFLGRIRGYKGTFALLEAFTAAALGDAAELHVAGKTSGDRARVRLKKRCRRTPRVTLHYGYVPDERMQVHLNAADFMVLPYREILSSAAAVLAASFGKAVIAPDLPCFAEVLAPGGWIAYDPERPGALTAALREAHARRDEAAAMGRASLARIRERTWAASAAATAALYRRVAPGAGGP